MSTAGWLPTADRFADWSGVRSVVAGLGASGFAAADALLRVGARVEVVEAAVPPVDSEMARRQDVLETLGAIVRTGVGDDFCAQGDLLVPSPGIAPRHRWITRAQTPTVWSGEQLAWQLRAPGVPWLTVTGTNGKTTTVQLVDAMLRQAGHRSMAAGNIGVPLAEAVFAEPAPDVMVVELSSFQLHFTRSVSAHTSALLNIARDHIDWHGSFEEYVADKATVYTGTERFVVYNHDDPVVERIAEDAEVVEGCRAVGFTVGIPGRSMVGVVDGVLVDRAFVAERATSAVELVSAAALPSDAPYFVSDVLAAAAVARGYGAPVEAIRRAAVDFGLGDHRGETVATLDGVRYVDNSKATNVHAADVALGAEDHVVWIAGGLAKGGEFDGLFERHAHRLRALVLIGVDQRPLAEAAQRHAAIRKTR